MQFLVHRWGLVSIGDDLDVGSAVGLLSCLQGRVELATGAGYVAIQSIAGCSTIVSLTGNE
jgi:hypothetical protein